MGTYHDLHPRKVAAAHEVLERGARRRHEGGQVDELDDAALLAGLFARGRVPAPDGVAGDEAAKRVRQQHDVLAGVEEGVDGGRRRRHVTVQARQGDADARQHHLGRVVARALEFLHEPVPGRIDLPGAGHNHYRGVGGGGGGGGRGQGHNGRRERHSHCKRLMMMDKRGETSGDG